ncbi:MAG: sigma-70 family RNA polymerase sigma factor [Bacteroidota bacterium]
MLVLEEEKVRTRETTIKEWYQEVFPIAAQYVKQRGGNLEDAKDIFQQSIVLYYEKIVHEGFQAESDDKTYLMGIVKKRWLKHYEKSTRTTGLGGIDLEEETEQNPIVQKLLNYLSRAGGKCMDLLQSFYYEKMTMNQLANRFGYTSERSATVQKYKCLEKVRNEIKQKALSYEDFLD